VLGQRHTLPDGQPLMSTVEGQPPFPVLLLRSGDEVKAYANRCAHFGVPLAAKQELLLFKPHISITCNVHYARYRWADGVCESGDCEGESLIAIPVVVDAQGQICIADPGAANATL
jgi:nitrite reductase/ring-hydroxylating ferredoxin subunit